MKSQPRRSRKVRAPNHKNKRLRRIKSRLHKYPLPRLKPTIRAKLCLQVHLRPKRSCSLIPFQLSTGRVATKCLRGFSRIRRWTGMSNSSRDLSPPKWRRFWKYFCRRAKSGWWRNVSRRRGTKWQLRRSRCQYICWRSADRPCSSTSWRN